MFNKVQRLLLELYSSERWSSLTKVEKSFSWLSPWFTDELQTFSFCYKLSLPTMNASSPMRLWNLKEKVLARRAGTGDGGLGRRNRVRGDGAVGYAWGDRKHSFSGHRQHKTRCSEEMVCKLYFNLNTEGCWLGKEFRETTWKNFIYLVNTRWQWMIVFIRK